MSKFSRNKQIEIFYPGFTGKDIRQIFNLNLINDHNDLISLAFLLTWRCQLTVLMDDVLDKREIQQTESQKFIARQISSNLYVKKVFAAISVSRTLNFEFKQLKDFSTDDARSEYLNEVISSLVNNSPPRGVKSLTPGSINSTNLNFHRYGIISELIGNCQSKPIFDPRSIIRGGVIGTIDSDGFVKIFKNSQEKLIGIENDKIGIEQLNKTLRKSIEFPELSIFNDSIDLGSSSNIAPIESIFDFKRTKPELPVDITLDNDETSPFLLNALEQSKYYNKTLNKRGVKPSSLENKKKNESKKYLPTFNKGEPTKPKAIRKIVKTNEE